MELTQEQLGYLYHLVFNNGNSLREILLEEFPKAEISLVVEYSYFGHNVILQGAFFSEERARDAMESLPKEIEQPPRYLYSILKGIILDIEEGDIRCEKTEAPIGYIDKELIYISLQERLLEIKYKI